MKITYIEYCPSGQILKCGSTYIASVDLICPSAPENTIQEIIEHCDPSLTYWDGAVVNMLPRPSDHHAFDYVLKTWVDPRTPETQWVLVRAERDRRLTACDWTQLPDAPASSQWLTYRQALRDITQQVDPFHIAWPALPN